MAYVDEPSHILEKFREKETVVRGRQIPSSLVCFSEPRSALVILTLTYRHVCEPCSGTRVASFNSLWTRSTGASPSRNRHFKQHQPGPVARSMNNMVTWNLLPRIGRLDSCDVRNIYRTRRGSIRYVCFRRA